ncbi:hypothetical protein EW145_g5875 [Phellinidium pouzarii]|uniref:Uncharacterized protein n=1 Tax=Phellinidium pouzarii TaxID=167371 RepID=A0A4S4L0B8_9AGAM|nr:hypothetical protein EW145_g5875 [Phellinidium pouzarii]
MPVDFISADAYSQQAPPAIYIQHRHRRRSSSLFALDTLSPPSPPLTPSTSVSACEPTSMTGEIPIIFAFLTTNSVSTEDRLTQMALLKPSLPPLAKFSPMSAFFPMNSSTGSLNTIGTRAFGTIRQSSSNCSNDPRCSVFGNLSMTDSPVDEKFGISRSPTTPMPLSISLSQHLISQSESTPGVQVLDYDVGQKKLSDVPHFTPSACSTFLPFDEAEKSTPSVFSNNLTRSMTHGTLRISNDSHLNIMDPRNKCISELPMFSSSQSLSTIQFAAITPTQSCFSGTALSPCISDIDDKTPTQATFLKRHALVKPLSRSSQQNLRLGTDNASSLRTSSSTSDLKKHFCYPQSEQIRKPASTYIPGEVTGGAKEDRSIFNDVNNIPSLGSTNLPVPYLRHAQWLRDTVVELWIDQEGFRAIRPKFYLASVSNGLPHSPRSDQRTLRGKEDDPLYTTVAEFLPVSRTPHFFHYAALDRAPTLNRITVNGDETRDYIARTATLLLREDGVFFVHGTEDNRIEPERIVRLNWRFEYFVSSRRPDGRSAHRGEKVLTPLSFSCTPALLDRARANKVKVLHIMKKTLFPNFVAQKLEPPDLPMLTTRLSSSSLVSIPVSDSHSSVSSQKSSGGIFAKASARIRRGSASESASRPLPFPPFKFQIPAAEHEAPSWKPQRDIIG